jgi:hypothetical protein
VPADDAPQREDEDLSMFLGDAKSENTAVQAPELVNKDKPRGAPGRKDEASADHPATSGPEKKNQGKGAA